MKYKVKSYTLLETVLSMVIISIIVVITYALLSSFLSQLKFYNETRDRLLDYILFKANLKNEFYHSKRILQEHDRLIMKFNNSEKIEYTFHKSYVLRENNENMIDTFFVELVNLNTVKISENIISKLSLRLVVLEESFDLSFNKRYGTHEYVNNESLEWK